jgi:hypothetical protein
MKTLCSTCAMFFLCSKSPLSFSVCRCKITGVVLTFGIRAGSVFGSKDVRQGKGTLKVSDARNATDAMWTFSTQEGSGQRRTHR